MSRTWATRRFCEVSSTTSKFGAAACEILSGVVLRKLSGDHVFAAIVDRYQAGKSVVVIEEGTGIQTTVGAGNEDGGPSIVDTLCQLSGSLFCVAKHKPITATPGSPGSLFLVPLMVMYAGPTWYEIWDCNSLDLSRPLRTVQCTVGWTSMFAEGGLVCTVTGGSFLCMQVTDPFSGIVVFEFKYPTNLVAQSVFSLLV